MITETYRDIEITLIEDENRWRFTVNGRERTCQTLPNARASIDKVQDAVVKDKKKAFEPIPAWYMSYTEEPQLVTITAFNFDEYRGVLAWIMRGKNRGKEEVTQLYHDNAYNRNLFATIKQCNAQADNLRGLIRTAKTQLQHIPVPKKEDYE